MHITSRMLAIAVAAVVGLVGGRAEGVPYYWDTDGSNGGFGNTAGTWGSSAFWSTDNTGASGTALTTITTSDGINFGTDTLALGSTAAAVGVSGAVSVNSITFGSAQATAVTLSGGTSITLGGTTPTITVNNAADTISSILAGSSFTKAGNGTLTLSGANTHSGTTTIGAGTLKLQGTNMWKTARTYTINGGSVLLLDGNVECGTGTAAATTINGAGTLRMNGWYGKNSGTGVTITMSLGAGGVIDIQTGAILQNGGWSYITWTGNSGGLNVDGTFQFADGSSVTVGALTGSGSITKGWGSETKTLTVGTANGSGTFSGTIANPAGVIALTKTGTGTQTLSGNNSYSGATSIGNGILAIAHNNALGNTTGNTTITANGLSTGPQLKLSGNITSPENISINGNTEQNQYSGVIYSTSGTNTLSGTITLNNPAGNIRITSGGGELIFGGTITQATSARTLILQAATGAALTVNNAIANNNGPLSVINAGAVTLKGTSTAIGATTVGEGGLLKLGVTNALKTTSDLTIGFPWNFTGSDQGTFDLTGFDQTVNALIGTKNTSNVGADSTRIVTNSAAAGTSILTVGNGNGTGTFNGVILDGATAKVALTKTGTGTQTLVGENTYSGPTTIGNGTLSLTHLNAMQHSPLDTANSVTGDASKGLKTNQSSLNLGGLSGNKDLAAVFTTTSGGYGSVSTLTLNAVTGADLSYSGRIANGAAGGMALNKTGAGSQTLSGANTYSGPTTVSSGVLRVNGSITGTVTVASGAYLGGTGAITGNVTYASGAFGLFTNDAPLRFTGPVTANVNTVYLALPNNLPVGNYVLATNTTGQFSGTFATTPAISSGSFVAGSAQTITTSVDSVVLQVTVLAVASTLAITDVNSGGNPTAGVPYSVTVQAQDAVGAPQNVTGDTGIVLSMFSGTAGSLGGTLSGTITNGQSSVIIAGVTNRVAESFTLQAATNSGTSLVAATTNYTIVAGPAAVLSVTGFPSAVAPGASNNVTVKAVDTYGNTITNYVGTVTLASTLGGASFVPSSPYTFLPADAGVKTFSAALNNFGLQDLTANDGSLSGQQTAILVAVPTSFYWTNTVSGAWGVTNNWTNDLGWLAAPVNAGQTNYTLNFNGSGAFTASNNLNGGFLLNQLNFGGATATLAGNSLTLTNNGATLPLVNQNSPAAISIGNELILGTDTTFGGSGTGTVTVAGAMSGAGGLTMAGTGTLTLVSTNSTYAGATTISNGTVKMGGVVPDVVSINFNAGDASSVVAGPAGALSATNWNNTPVGASGSMAVNSQMGVAAGTVSWSCPNTWNGGPSTTTQNNKLFKNYLDCGAAGSANSTTIIVSNITASLIVGGYDVYVYLGGDSDHTAWISATGTDNATSPNTSTKYLISNTSALRSGDPLVESVATVSGSATAANYVMLQGFTGNKVTLTFSNGTAGRCRPTGIQIKNRGCGGSNALPTNTALSIASGATLDLSGNAQTVASVSDSGGGGGAVTNSSSTSATLTINPSAGSTTFSGAIRGPISLVKSGIATQVLAGASAYAGGTTVSNGALLVNGSITGAVSVASGATLGGTGAITGDVAFATGALALFTKDAQLTFTGPVTLNTNTVHLTLPDNLAVGTYLLATNTTSSFSGTFAAEPVIASGSTVGSRYIVTDSGSVNLVVSSTPIITIVPATLPAVGMNLAYSQTLTASGGTAPYTNTVIAGGLPAGLTLDPGGVLSGTPTTAGTSNFTVQAMDALGYTGTREYSLTIEAPNFFWTAASGNWDSTGNWTNDFGTPVAPSATGRAYYTLNFKNAGTYTSTHNLNSGLLLNQLNFGGATATLAGNSLTLTNNGATLPRINQNSGAAVLIGNSMVLGANTTFGGSGGGALTLSGAISGAASLTKTTSGTLTLSGTVSYTGATVINAGTLDASGQGTTPLSSSSGVTFTGNSTFIYLFASALPAMTVNAGVTAQVNNASSGGNTGSTMPSLSGGGTFSVDNPGGTGQGKGITFGDMSSFTGVLQISLTGAGMYFQMPNLNDTAVNNIRFTGGAGTTPQKFIYTGSSPLTLSNRAFEVAVNASGGQVNIVNNGSGVFTINKALIVTAPNAKTLSLGGSNTGTNTFAGAITNGTGAVINLTKADGGKWILSGANTYSGTTTISGGTLEIGGAGVLGGGSYAGSISTSGGSTSFRYNSTAAQTLSGVIGGTAALVKMNNGTLRLAGDNSYGGTTTVNNGTLLINGDQSSAAGTVTVENGTTLGGTGKIGGTATVQTGGTLSPGDGGPGTLTFANGLTLQNTVTLAMQLGTTSDQVRVTGGTFIGAASAGSVAINITDAGGLNRGTYTLIEWTGASGVELSDFTLTMPANWFGQLAIEGSNKLVLKVRTAATLMMFE